MHGGRNMKFYNKVCMVLLFLSMLTGCTVQGCEEGKTILQEQECSTYEDIEVASIDKKVLIVYYDPLNILEPMTKSIQEKMAADTFEINSGAKVSIEKYDIILLGNEVIEEKPPQEMIAFLNQYSLEDKIVSTYWMNAMDNEVYERTMTNYINSSIILPGLGVNSDEIAEQRLVNVLIDGWLTSVYMPF